VTAVFAVALADWRARTRSAAFMLVLAFALAAGYWFVPERDYVTVDLGGYRGIYNSAWMGAMAALLCVLLIWFVGFFVVRGSLVREARFGVAELVAATPVRTAAFVAGKWLSNVALLAAIAALMFVAAAAMQYVRAEDRRVDPVVYAQAYLGLVVPVCALVGAAALLFDAIRPLRGIAGGVVWFFGGTGLIIASGTLAQRLMSPEAADPLGFAIALTSMAAALHAAVPAAHTSDVSIGVVSIAGPMRTFVFGGIAWTPEMAAGRATWAAGALIVVLLCTACFDRFRAERVGSARSTSEPLAARLVRALPDVAGARLTRAEIGVLLADAGVPWLAVYLGLAVAACVAPAQALVAIVLPAALIWPLTRYAPLGTADRRFGVAPVIAAAPDAGRRTVAARVAAGTIVAGIPLIGIVARHPSLAGVPVAAAALALLAGSLSGTPRLFEALFIAFWYAGINRVPGFDLAADAASAPAATCAVSALLAALAAALSVLAASASDRGR